MSKAVLGFRFDPDECIQCHACEVACVMWRGLEKAVKWRRVISNFHGSYPNAKMVPVAVSCLHCNEPACVSACPVGAISKRESDGVVLVSTDLCVGCRACFEACPVDAPQFGADGLMQKCDLCVNIEEGEPPCVRTCPTRCLTKELIELEEKAMLDEKVIAEYNYGR